MSSESRRETAAKIRALLDTEGPNIEAQARELNAGRIEATESLAEYEDLREEARAIKEDAIERIPELVDTVEEAVEARGGNVYLADDAADANRYIESVCEGVGAETLVKSKSMTTEELDVNDALAEAGVDPYETDLGEFVVQIADESPSHLVGPAMHRSREDIADLLNDYFEPDEPLESAADMTAFVRDYLGDRIREADVGMTGANFVAADSGSMALVTNEGNARKCASTPPVHVAVAGVEKLIPTVDDLEPFVALLSKAATGQSISQYVSVLSPPVDTPIPDFDADAFRAADEREFHLVLVDNGRMAMREDDDLRETLYCVRCGACSNSCANFQQVGGHAFGGETYTGGIATGWEAGVHGQDSAAECNDLCTGCTRCVNACPVKIDIPWINTVVRDRINRDADPERFGSLVEGLTPDEEPGGLDRQKRFFGNVETLAKVGSALAPVSNWVAGTTPARVAMERVLGVDRRRDLPEFARESFVDWFADRGGSRVEEAAAARSAVVYPDVYTNYVSPERGKATVRALEALDVHVRVPKTPGSGRAPLSQGMISTARSKAEAVHDALAPHLDAGRDVVVVEPSALAMFASDYERLLPGEEYARLADSSYEVCEYVYGRLSNDADADALAALDGDLAYHSHCQQRTLGLEAHTVAVLEACGASVRTSDVECCGMAGSFGYKEQYYDLSVDVGDPLAEDFAAADRVVASGTSCADQLESLLDAGASHPIELIAP
jgi:iron-sulfur cluster protein